MYQATKWMFCFPGPPEQLIIVKPGFHIVVTGRLVSLTVFHGHWSIWVVGNTLPVVGGLLGSLTVFQSLHLNCCFLAPNLLSVAFGLSGSLAVAKGIMFRFHMTQIKQQGPWRSFSVVHGR